MEIQKTDLKSIPGPHSSGPISGPVNGQQPLTAGTSNEYSTAALSTQRSSAGFVQTQGSPVGPYDVSVAPYDGIVTAQGPQGPSGSPYIQIQPQRSGPLKKAKTAYKMSILGFLGLHHFYLNRPKFGVLYLFTGGLLLIGWLIDFCRMPLLVKQANDMIEHPEKYKNKRTMLDAYILWFPLGFFGAHHYYLGRMHWGVAYTFTLGLLGVGWVIDGVRMKQLVKEANETQSGPQDVTVADEKKLSECYILAVTPLGILGAHYYYLERWMFAVIYTFTLGLFGIGWLVDLFTLPYVFERANKIRRKEVDPKRVYISEAYKLVFPLGFLGLHHFYLRRPGWGVLYFCTCGCLLVGWIVDFFRLPSLVRETNAAAEREAANLSELQNRLDRQPPQPTELLPPAPPQYSPRPMLKRYPPDSNVQVRESRESRGNRDGRTERTPLQKTSAAAANRNDLPPPYTPRASSSNSRAVASPPRPPPSPMDVITEEDEDAISVISSASRQMASANDVTLENTLNDQIYANSRASSLSNDVMEISQTDHL